MIDLTEAEEFQQSTPKTFEQVLAEVMAMPSVIAAENKATASAEQVDKEAAEIKQRIHEALRCLE